MARQVTAVLTRTGENTLAILHASRTSAVKSPQQLLDAITLALTYWVSNTEDGRQAWEDSTHDFNIGDLSNWIDEDGVDPESTLAPFLKTAGVQNLTIHTTNDNDTHEYTYDSVLVNQ